MATRRKTKYDYSELRGRIIARFGSQRAFAEAYGISEIAMSKKLNGGIGITTDDIDRMSSDEYLCIRPEDYHIYFFKKKVQ